MKIPITTTEKVFRCLVNMTDDGTFRNPWKIGPIDPDNGLSISTILNLWTVTVTTRDIHVSQFPHAELTLSHMIDADTLVGQVYQAKTPLLFEQIRHFVQCIHEGYGSQHAKWLKQAMPNL